MAVMRAAAVACLAGALAWAVPAAASSAQACQRPPATARKPQAADTLPRAIEQTSAVIEGVVSRIEYEYTEEEGPWTVVTLSNTQTHLGKAPSEVKIRQFGGPLPNGHRLVVAELTELFHGERYLMFLRNTAWNLSPIVSQYALRVEIVGGREFLVNDEGQAIIGLGESGLEFSSPLFPRPDVSGISPSQETATRPVAAALALDRAQLIGLLKAEVSTRGARVGGEFFDCPAGEFQWRRVATMPHGANTSPATPAGPVRSSPERDISRPSPHR
ncbi:hypothetical protein [Hyalangium minutum]|uniref:hypothetical protein n=1 Tax=Hyalangium minutum TaxID=394096 RepID=UPI0012F732B6|nr:hypothetical protein [Hyalangium minutum]